MANILNLLFEQEFTNVTNILVTHNTGLEYYCIKVVIDGASREELVTNIVPTVGNETNECTVTLSSAQTGKIQIFSHDVIDVGEKPISTRDEYQGVETQDDTVPIVTNTSAINFGSNLAVIDDGNGIITVNATAAEQNIWYTIQADDSSSAIPNVPTDTLVVAGGTGISTSIVGDTLTITNDAPNGSIETQELGVQIEPDTTIYNFTGVVNVTNPAPGQVDVDIAPGLSNLASIAAYQLTGTDANLSELMIFTDDTTRGGKTLSQETFNFTFASNSVNNDDWMPASHVADAVSGLIIPYDATLVRATGHCVDTSTNSKDFYVYRDGVAITTPAIGSLIGGPDVSFTTTNLNIDFNAGQKLRLRAGSVGGRINDTLISIWLKWRYTGV